MSELMGFETILEQLKF